MAITKDQFFSMMGAVSIQRYNALAASVGVVLNLATGESPQEVATKLREEVHDLMDLSRLMAEDIDSVRNRLRQLEERKAHVDSVAKTVEDSAVAIEKLPGVRFSLDPSVMGEDMPGAEHEVVWSAANAPADEYDENGDLIIGDADENEQ